MVSSVLLHSNSYESLLNIQKGYIHWRTLLAVYIRFKDNSLYYSV